MADGNLNDDGTIIGDSEQTENDDYDLSEIGDMILNFVAPLINDVICEYKQDMGYDHTDKAESASNLGVEIKSSLTSLVDQSVNDSKDKIGGPYGGDGNVGGSSGDVEDIPDGPDGYSNVAKSEPEIDAEDDDSDSVEDDEDEFEFEDLWDVDY